MDVIHWPWSRLSWIILALSILNEGICRWVFRPDKSAPFSSILSAASFNKQFLSASEYKTKLLRGILESTETRNETHPSVNWPLKKVHPMILTSYILSEDMPPLELRQRICLLEVASINYLPKPPSKAHRSDWGLFCYLHLFLAWACRFDYWYGVFATQNSRLIERWLLECRINTLMALSTMSME